MPLIGEPAQTPPPPDVTAPYPSLTGRTDTRATKPMTPAERAKAEADLAAAAQRAADERRQQMQR